MQGMQLLKLPNLIAHVEDHFGSDWSWSELKTFVVDHYVSTKLPKDKEHENLPFKTVVNNVLPLAFNASETPAFVMTTFVEEQRLPVISTPVDPTVDRSGAIWTPPQLS